MGGTKKHLQLSMPRSEMVGNPCNSIYKSPQYTRDTVKTSPLKLRRISFNMSLSFPAYRSK
jgi:hypothetical protein